METNREDWKLIFEKEGVYLHTNAKRSNQETSLPGYIRIVERAGVPALEWSPLEDEGRSAPAVLYSKKNGEGGEEDTKFDPGYEPDWAVISTVKKNREPVPVQASGALFTFHCKLQYRVGKLFHKGPLWLQVLVPTYLVHRHRPISCLEIQIS